MLNGKKIRLLYLVLTIFACLLPCGSTMIHANDDCEENFSGFSSIPDNVTFPGECNPETSDLEWDWDSSEDTASIGETATIYVIGGTPPYNWAITGGGNRWQLTSADTNTPENAISRVGGVNPDCGVTITVTDSSSCVTTGSLRDPDLGYFIYSHPNECFPSSVFTGAPDDDNLWIIDGNKFILGSTRGVYYEGQFYWGSIGTNFFSTQEACEASRTSLNCPEGLTSECLSIESIHGLGRLVGPDTYTRCSVGGRRWTMDYCYLDTLGYWEYKSGLMDSTGSFGTSTFVFGDPLERE